jgi:gluconolactonase
LLLLLLANAWAPGVPGQSIETKQPPFSILGKIERLDPAFDKLIAPDAKMEILAEGFDWSEGPVWHTGLGGLLFSDIPPNRVYLYRDGNPIRLFLTPSGYTGATPRGGEPGSNGLHLDRNGRLILMQHGDRRVAALSADGKSFETLADRFDGKRFNSPNDATFKSNGDLYFTDPPYGLVKNVDDPAKELAFQGVYRLSQDGRVELLTKEMSRPNGIAFSPDEKTLYVANSDPERAIWMAYPVTTEGTIGPGKVFFDASPLVKAGRKGLPDGLKVDSKGNLFATGPGGILVFSPEGKHLGTMATGEATANCAWGDDFSTLYITADMYLARIRTKTKGHSPLGSSGSRPSSK